MEARPRNLSRIARECVLVVAYLVAGSPLAADDTAETAIGTIARIKNSVVAIGTYERTGTPPFQFRGTGFAVGDGTYIITNAHVVAGNADVPRKGVLGIMLPAANRQEAQFREAREVAVDPGTDLALLKIGAPALPPIRIGTSDGVREGQSVLFTGFPIGSVLGPYPATHRGMVASVTPIAIPQGRTSSLNSKVIRRLTTGSFPVFQLDATAYPGNSGSPVYDSQSGDLLGVINMVLVKGTKESALTQPSGITYAIPAKYVIELMQKAQ